MSRRPLRIATTPQLERSAREAGFDVFRLPDLPTYDFHRSIEQRLTDGYTMQPFLEKHDIELVLDFNTEALTLTPLKDNPEQFTLTTAQLGIPYVACYLDPITSTMNRVDWAMHWKLLESPDWIKWIPETTHSEELIRLGIPNVLTLPMAQTNDDFDTTPLPAENPNSGVGVSFMGHPASGWFNSNQQVAANSLFNAYTAIAVHEDLPDLAFHKICFDLYKFCDPPFATDDDQSRALKAGQYYGQKFLYNAYLAVRHRDRFIKFLSDKLGKAFELIGDHWGTHYGLPHEPRIWDMKQLHRHMREVPICLNMIKGNWETGLIIRHFEVPAFGGFMLTYETQALSECFEIGTECDVFHNEADLLDKIHYYLENPGIRRDIALAGQKRVLSEHLYSHRIATMVAMLRQAGLLKDKAVESTSLPNTNQNIMPVAGAAVTSTSQEAASPCCSKPTRSVCLDKQDLAPRAHNSTSVEAKL